MTNHRSVTSRAAKDRIQKQKRRNRRDDLPDCASLEELSTFKDDLLDEGSDVNPYDWSYSKKDKNFSEAKVFGDVETAVSRSIHSSSAPSVIALTKTLNSTNDTIDEVDSSNSSYSDSKLIKSSSKTSSRGSRRHRRKSLRTEWRDGSTHSLRKIRAALEESIAKHGEAPLQVGNIFMEKVMCISGDIFTKFVSFILTLSKYFVNHPTPMVILIGLIGGYFIILYLELSLAAFIELSMQFFWPTMHILLRGAERFFKLFGNFLGQLDDLGQAVYCDLAHVWCRRFNMMCEDRCSFVEMAVDRMRT